VSKKLIVIFNQMREGGRTVTSVVVWIDLVLLNFNEKLVL
jgi:hypothetical protein